MKENKAQRNESLRRIKRKFEDNNQMDMMDCSNFPLNRDNMRDFVRMVINVQTNKQTKQPNQENYQTNRPTERTDKTDRSTDQPTNPMEQSPSWEAYSSSAKKDIHRILRYLDPTNFSLSRARIIQARFPILFPYPPTYSQVFQVISFLQVSEPKPRVHFSSPPTCHTTRQSDLLYLIAQSMRSRKYNS